MKLLVALIVLYVSCCSWVDQLGVSGHGRFCAIYGLSCIIAAGCLRSLFLVALLALVAFVAQELL